jgi:hypothetical protein
MTEVAPHSAEDLARLAGAMSSCVPELTIKSTVALVASKHHMLRQIGTGTLLAVAEHRFVVTAAHVVRKASESEATLGFSGTKDGRFVATVEKWFLTTEFENDSDRHDVAIYELTPEQSCRFDDANFVRIADVAFPQDMSNKYCVVTGFPSMWSIELGPSDETMKSKLLQYGTYSLEGSTAALDGFDPERHFLLEASPSLLLDHTGRGVSFRTRTGHPASMPTDLQGVSGCSVWVVGDLRRSVDSWSKDAAKLVGVETGIYGRRSAIKVTRWNSVTTLLYNAVPQIRPVLEMYV